MGGLDADADKKTTTQESVVKAERKFREPRDFKVSDEELSAHDKMLGDIKNPIWEEN